MSTAIILDSIASGTSTSLPIELSDTESLVSEPRDTRLADIVSHPVSPTSSLASLADIEDGLYPFDEPPHASQPVLCHPPLPLLPQTSMEAARAHTQELAQTQAVCAVTGKSSSAGGRCLMVCVRGGLGGNHHKRSVPMDHSELDTSKCGCPFAIEWRLETIADAAQAGRGRDNRLWWPFVISNEHNHEPQRLLDIAYLRQLSRTPQAEATIREHLTARLQVSQIVRLMRIDYPDILITRQDVRNFRIGHAADLRAGRSATEAAVERLKDSGDLFRAWRNDAGELCGLVFTTAEARAMTHMYPTVLFIDCTFRTNRYRLPMLHICGFTATNQTYTAAIGFLSRGAEQWYDLAIGAFLDLIGIAKAEIKVIITDREDALTNAIDGLLPHVHRLSCRWHLRENIKLAAKPCFADLEDWKGKLSAYGNFWLANIANAASQDALDDGLASLRRKWNGERYDRANAYIQTMVDDIKELFVAAFIDRHPHFGQTSNSRLEGAHRSFKRDLGGAHHDLFHVIEHAKTFMSEQIGNIMAAMGRQRVHRSSHVLRILDRVRQRVSDTAIDLMTAQHRQAQAWLRDPDTTPPRCTGRFRTAHGLPCAHDFMGNLDRLISITAIHRQWRLINPLIWDQTVAEITAHVDSETTAGTSAVHQLSGPDWELDNDTNVIRDPHLRQNRPRTARQPAQDASDDVSAAPEPLTTTTTTPLPPLNDDIILESQAFFEDRPIRVRSPRRGERSTATQVLADIDSNTGRLHTRAEKQLGKRKATRPCCFCAKRHRPHNCPTGRELKARDQDLWTVRCEAWDTANAENGGSETDRRLATLEQTLQGFMTSMAARETQRTAMEMETVTTRARMVASTPWMGSAGPWMGSTGSWMGSTGPWMASTGSWATPVSLCHSRDRHSVVAAQR